MINILLLLILGVIPIITHMGVITIITNIGGDCGTIITDTGSDDH